MQPAMAKMFTTMPESALINAPEMIRNKDKNGAFYDSVGVRDTSACNVFGTTCCMLGSVSFTKAAREYRMNSC